MYWVEDSGEAVPENLYDKLSNWDFGNLVIGENEESSNIRIVSEETVILSKNTVDGETSWKIKSINGWEIPKNIVIE
jgi:uncharacterized protein YjdB